MKSESPGKTGDRSKERFLKEFEIPTYTEWRQEAEAMLKGAPFEKKLLTKTFEGITLKPIYNADDLEGIEHLDGLPGSPGYVRGTKPISSSKASWLICQEVGSHSPREANESLLADLARGQNAIRFLGQITTVSEMELLFKDIDISKYPVYLGSGMSGLATLAILAAYGKKTGTDLKTIQGAVENSPLEALEQDGTLTTSLDRAYDELAASTAWASQYAPLLKTIAVQAHPTHEAGGSAVEELAFGVATGVEYLHEMTARDLDVDTAATRMLFSFSVGGNFFMEMAKLRAARLLWSRVVKEFGGKDGSGKMALHVKTSAWTKTICDPYVNMLRATTETLSAAVGGADSIQTSPFDEPFRQPDEFSRRIARNVQIVLGEESHIGAVMDPAGGSYYVEWLTNELASRAWSLFQEVEKQGGMSGALKKGFPQEILRKLAEARFKNFATRKSVIVGVNMYANALEKPLVDQVNNSDGFTESREATLRDLINDPNRKERVSKLLNELRVLNANSSLRSVELAVDAASAGAFFGEIRGAYYGDSNWGSVEIEPFEIHRASMKYERMREAVEQYAKENGSRPKVFLANMGPIPQHKARADFAIGFFEVGGFEVQNNKGFATPQEAADAVATSGASVCVICSTDQTYPDLVPPFSKALKEKAPSTKIVLAGYPEDQIEAHKEAGVDEFIHVKADNYRILSELLSQIGVAI